MRTKTWAWPPCCFPATGVHLNLGAKPYWPVYAEAARLGIPVVVHGGGHWDLGMETMNVSTGANAIGHPMSLAIALAEMVLNNLFERFSGLRVAYLEGGPLWFLMALERLSRSFEAGTPVNPRGELLQLPEGQTVAEYIFGLVRAGRLVVGIEGGESDLPYAIKVAGEQAFMFSSDFPHEVNLQTIRKEIHELQERKEISDGCEAGGPARQRRQILPVGRGVKLRIRNRSIGRKERKEAQK